MAVFFVQTPIRRSNSDAFLSFFIDVPHASIDELLIDLRSHTVIAARRSVHIDVRHGVKHVVANERVILGSSYVGIIQEPRCKVVFE